MTRKLKALGLAFVAVLAFGALSATAASAASFHSEVEHTFLDGAQPVAEDNVFTVTAGTVKCTSATYSGTQSTATSEKVTVTPTYSGCTAFGFVNSPIDTNGCTYTFNATNDDLIISCPEGKALTVTAFNCTLTIGSQTINSGISYDNAGSGTSRDVTITANLIGLSYTQTDKSFPQCLHHTGTYSNGAFRGRITVTGTNTTGGAVGVWWSA